MALSVGTAQVPQRLVIEIIAGFSFEGRIISVQCHFSKIYI